MRTFEQHGGLIQNIGGRVRRGFLAAGLDKTEVEELIEGFLDSPALEEAAKQEGLRLVESRMSAPPPPLEFIAEGVPVVVEVDFDKASDDVLRIFGYDPDNLEHQGQRPSGKHKVILQFGRFNRNWTEEQVAEWLPTQTKFAGSGAWVMAAYKGLHPNGDGQFAAFPDPETSRWLYRYDRNVCFPGFWDGGGCRLLHVRHEWDAGRRVCLRLREEVQPLAA